MYVETYFNRTRSKSYNRSNIQNDLFDRKIHEFHMKTVEFRPFSEVKNI